MGPTSLRWQSWPTHDLIVCVDCGTLSHGPIAAAQGADVIVLDHHLGAETLPPALAVVNPNRQDETALWPSLCCRRGFPDAGRSRTASCATLAAKART